MVKIILAEDHHIVRDGIKSLLFTDGSFTIIAEGSNGLEILDKKDALKEADILITDINMDGMNGISLTQEITKSYPNLKVIILSMLEDENYIFEAFGGGAKGYLLKNISANELIFCIKYIVNGGEYLCAELSIKMLKRQFNTHKPKTKININTINERELEMLKLLANGLTNQEMADKLFVSKRTVEGYRQQLIEKTKSKNTASLIKFSIENGII